MDKFDRIQQLHRIFSSRRTPISLRDLADKLECSERTILRSINTLRDQIQAPLEYCKERRGWHYIDQDGASFELPGLWLTADEIQGLAIISEITQGMNAGVLADDFKLVTQAVDKLLHSRQVAPDIFKEKVHYLPKHRQHAADSSFQQIGSVLLKHKQLHIAYSDYSGRKTQRTISPLKLVHYDENWYLDAWCHLRKALRSFMLARIVSVEARDEAAHTISPEQQHQHFSSSYGIFAGKAKHLAKLKFNGSAAREAASYQWHPEQTGTWENGDYKLSIPYNDDRELIRTLLGYGDKVEVLAPSVLKKKVLTKAKQIVSTYDPGWGGGRF